LIGAVVVYLNTAFKNSSFPFSIKHWVAVQFEIKKYGSVPTLWFRCHYVKDFPVRAELVEA